MRVLDKRRIIIIFISVVIFLTHEAKAAEMGISGRTSETDKIEYKAEGLRDPFQEQKIEIKEEPEAEVETKPLPALQVQGIVWGGSIPQAIINNKVVRVGDTIEEARIVDITKNGIIVFSENKKYNLPIPSLTNLQNSQQSPSRR